MAQYINLAGLTTYDKLIKNLINNADKELGKRIDAIVEDCGENSGSISEIKGTIGEVSSGKTLADLISDLSKEDDRLEKMIPKSSEVKEHCLYMY